MRSDEIPLVASRSVRLRIPIRDPHPRLIIDTPFERGAYGFPDEEIETRIFVQEPSHVAKPDVPGIVDIAFSLMVSEHAPVTVIRPIWFLAVGEPDHLAVAEGHRGDHRLLLRAFRPTRITPFDHGPGKMPGFNNELVSLADILDESPNVGEHAAIPDIVSQGLRDFHPHALCSRSISYGSAQGEMQSDKIAHTLGRAFGKGRDEERIRMCLGVLFGILKFPIGAVFHDDEFVRFRESVEDRAGFLSGSVDAVWSGDQSTFRR